MTRREQLIKKTNEHSIYANYKDDKEYYKRKKIKPSFSAITHSMLMSDAYFQLTDRAKILYLYMIDYANGKKRYTFPKSIYSKIMTNETFKKKKLELINLGFIEEIQNGKNTRTKNVYEFIDTWKTIKNLNKEKRKTHFNKKS